MDITLVTASNSKEVHGTDNDKKTGCGINLLRGENITVYRRIGRMTDLKEITCERCKANLAKKMIKADKKEMSRMLKEEKQRAKMGMGDEGIVPLGNTTAKITSAPRTYNSPAPQRNNAPAGGGYGAPAPQMQNDPTPAQPAPPQHTIPGTGVAIDDSLAAFAINKPVAEPEPQPAAPQDDFMTQFAVQKPVAEEQPAAPAQDDFLAQFAVPSAEQPVQNSFDTYQPEPAPAAPPVIDNVDDILSMFSVDNMASQGVPSAAANPYGAAPQQPTYGAPQPAFNAAPQQPLYGTSQPAYNAAPQQPAFVPVQPFDPVQPAMGGMSDFDAVSGNLYGAAPQQPAAPVFDDLSAPVQQPAFNDIPMQQSAFNDIPVQSAPAFDDLTVPSADAVNTAPVFNDITSDIPSINDIASVPGLDDLSGLSAFDTAPAEKVDLNKEDYMGNTDTFNAASAPAPQAVQPQPQIITVPQLAGYDQGGQPVYNYVQMQMTGLDPNGQPIFTPVNQASQAPAAQAQPAPAPARPAAPYTGAPKANVSKIAVNPHAKQTSQAFIRAIASSKEYADKNLIDTQGLVANTPILSSIEDVLSTMGDDSARQQMLAKQKEAQQEKTVTSFSEYKGPNGGMNNRRPVPPQFRNTPSQQQSKDPRMMTKSELKAYKKQEKIEAKFKKEMAKRGGY